MIIPIVKSFVYIITELLPLDGDAHARLLSYYFNYVELNNEVMAVLYVALMVGISIYFYKEIFMIFSETFRGVWLIISGRKAVRLTSVNFKMFNMLLVIIIIVLASIYPFSFLKMRYYDLCFIGIMLIVSAVILRLSKIFTLVKTDGRILGIKETIVFSLLQILSFLPGMPRTVLFIGIGQFMGVQSRHLATLTFISLIPILAVQLFFMDFKGFYILNLIYEMWSIFLVLVVLSILSMSVVFRIVISQKFYKFYFYLAGLGIWTILDVFFTKKGF